MTADLFDNAAGVTVYEYLQAVVQSGAETGRERRRRRAEGPGRHVRRPEGLPVPDHLPEISVTAMPAVPGARVTAVRAAPVLTWASDEEKLQAFRKALLADVQDVLVPSRAATRAERRTVVARIHRELYGPTR